MSIPCPQRVAFVSGASSWWRRQGLTAKYVGMRVSRVIYPDVYALARFFGDHVAFVQEGVLPSSKYDLLLSELQGHEDQLEYLDGLVTRQPPPVAVIPGPPEILSRGLTDRKLALVQRILRRAAYVWAYSPTVQAFCDGLIGEARARLIPWPFDFEGVTRLAAATAVQEGNVRVVLQVPLRFGGTSLNHPLVLKGVLASVWRELPPAARQRLTFHSFAYTEEDRAAFRTTAFADGLPISLEPKRSYATFVRWVARASAVVNLSTTNVLGRITFLAAALGKPGIFSDNVEINRVLYPGSCVRTFDTPRLRELLRALLEGVAAGLPSVVLRPDMEAARVVGDFAANSARMRELVAETAGSPRGPGSLTREDDPPRI